MISQLLNWLMPTFLLQPVLKPVSRLILGLIAVPFFRLVLHRVVRVRDMSDEMEKDLEQWFRGALILLLATKNVEMLLFNAVSDSTREKFESHDWMFMAGRILLAMGVIEGMPDQALFSVIHPGPPRLKLQKGRIFGSLADYVFPFLKGMLCQHLNRSSPMFVILATIFGDQPGWIFYGIAITQYLIIGLVTSRDRALDVLRQFDIAVARQREELEETLQPETPPLPAVLHREPGEAVHPSVLAATQELQSTLPPADAEPTPRAN